MRLTTRIQCREHDSLELYLHASIRPQVRSPRTGDLRRSRGHAVSHLIFSKTIQQTSVQVDVWVVDWGHAGLKG